MKKVVLIVLAALIVVAPRPSAAQQYSEPSGLPPCEPGDGAFLFANWPCDPNTSIVISEPPITPPVEPPLVETGLPPCEPGGDAVLFANWPCDPNATGPWPTTTMYPCPQAASGDPISPCYPPPQPPPPPPPEPTTPWYCPSWAWWCSQKPIVASYVALGDSVAYGLISLKGYVFRYQEGLEEKIGGAVDTQNMSAPGVSSEILLANLTSNTIMRDRLAQADYITWNVGGKDLLDARAQYQAGRCGGEDNQACLQQTTTNLKTNWNGIVGQVQTLRQSDATVSALDIYNPFVNEDQAIDSWPNDAGSDFAVFKPYLDDVNDHLYNSTTQANMRLILVSNMFNGPAGTRDPELTDLISFDGFHPNDKGHTLIADRLLSRAVAN